MLLISAAEEVTFALRLLLSLTFTNDWPNILNIFFKLTNDANIWQIKQLVKTVNNEL